MKIADMKVSAYVAKHSAPISNGKYTYATTQIVICHLITDEGVDGFGIVHDNIPVIVDTLNSMKERIIGQDPFNYERIWDSLYLPKVYGRKGFETRALSAIDIALWDIMGKVAGRPIQQLLGGYSQSIPAYMAGGYYAPGKGLKELQEENVPVLWRPLHEFDGGWFWWGKCGPQLFIQLWRLMYDRFTNLHQLNNLIWVLGYSGEMRDGWYPGDAYVDCIGGDAYSDGIHEELYHWVTKQTSKDMPVCHHENGPLPEPGLMRDLKVEWCWFLTWHTIHIHKQNSADYVNYVYNHPYVITLEDLQREKPF